MNIDQDRRECPGCGSSQKNRQQFLQKNSEDDGPTTLTALWNCPHCHSLKCCMCDMGDDTECISCNNSDEED